ncbi:MAG: hypothetical protein WCC06_05100 [Candidatus Aminicenantales bacterium]
MKKWIFLLAVLAGTVSFMKSSEMDSDRKPGKSPFLGIVITCDGAIVFTFEREMDCDEIKKRAGNIVQENRNADCHSPRVDLNRKYEKGTRIAIYLFYQEPLKYEYAFKVETKKRERISIPIWGAPAAKMPISGEWHLRKLEEVNLSEDGTEYAIAISRKKLKDGVRSEEEGIEVFRKTFQTYERYYFGVHLGILFPFQEETEYMIDYANPTDEKRSILRDDVYRPILLFYGAFYPFKGFEPESSDLWTCRRIHFDFGVGLSQRTVDRIYLGVGYDLTYISLNVLFLEIGKIGEPREGFKEGYVNDSIKEIPYVYKFRVSPSIGISLPLHFAVNWLGKVLGLK